MKKKKCGNENVKEENDNLQKEKEESKKQKYHFTFIINT